ncbi:hypothetical protein N8T08_011060 [Aspergillus melleus]|uniref:Uncharacterized protein n=1 Tax=Aspergillus melleus TaxID=138277 RepID=A0ACC3AQF2_9EURO|nr:hypothetical protein N8T08_011060 [Aspergillus melleus]
MGPFLRVNESTSSLGKSLRQAARRIGQLIQSRFGCRNCKLRKLKPTAASDKGRHLMTRGKSQLQLPVASAVWTSDESTCFQLNAKCQDFITRYLGDSLITPDDPNMRCVNRRLLELAFTYPCLMHASLAVAYSYDRRLNSPVGHRRSLSECYHWSQSTALLNKRLREPIQAQDRDPIWGTAAALAILSFSSPDATTPEKSWPLNPSDHAHLDWLRLSKGKMSLWHIVNPLRPDSLFCVMATTFAQMQYPLPERGVDRIPQALAGICLLDDRSTAENNPYFDAAHALSHILNLPDSEVTTGRTQLFPRCIYGSFEDLLRQKDPVALVLLYLWYRKAGRGIWWIELRARVECPSICEYLRIHHGGNAAVQAFLPGGALADRWD